MKKKLNVYIKMECNISEKQVIVQLMGYLMLYIYIDDLAIML